MYSIHAGNMTKFNCLYKFFEKCLNASIKSHAHLQCVYTCNNCASFKEYQPKGVSRFDCINLGTLLKDAHLPGIHHSISRMHFVQPDQKLSGKTDKPQPLRGGQHLTYSLLTLGYEKTEYCKAVKKTVPQPHRQLSRFWDLGIKKITRKMCNLPFQLLATPVTYIVFADCIPLSVFGMQNVFIVNARKVCLINTEWYSSSIILHHTWLNL
jgi:hypothetical protein